MKLEQVGVLDLWPCLCLPRVCHLWMLEDGLCSLVQLCQLWLCQSFVTAGSECEAQEAGWSQRELLLSPALQFPCVWGCLPGAWVGSLTDACMVPWPSSSSQSLQWPLLRHVCWKGLTSCVYSFLSPGFRLLPGILSLFLAALHMCLLENLVTT